MDQFLTAPPTSIFKAGEIECDQFITTIFWDCDKLVQIHYYYNQRNRLLSPHPIMETYYFRKYYKVWIMKAKWYLLTGPSQIAKITNHIT